MGLRQALTIYAIPSSALFVTWLVMFGLVPALDALLPIFAIGMLIWTYIEFDKVKRLQAAQRRAAKGNPRQKSFQTL
jgi:hypothetical protein